MGKSTTAEMFRAAGAPVYDADATVHALYSGAACAPIEAEFPGTVKNGSVDRQALSRIVLNDPVRMKRLESIIHPLVAAERQKFLAEQRRLKAPIVVLDIPLLFETGADTETDYIVVVSAPANIQRQRVLARPNMDESRFQSILAKQMPDEIKRAKADFIIETGKGLDAARDQDQTKMREIVLDTETTGLDPAQGHRVVEIGCVELFNSIPTGQTYHVYLNPERDMPEEAQRIHGLSLAFLKDKQTFAQIVDEFLSFIGNDQLVIHNAEFDIKFLNAELKKQNRPVLTFDRVLDTLALARRRNPGGSNSLDALCNRYNIDNSRRTKHGALLDSEILAEVYAELLGGRQSNLGLSDVKTPKAGVQLKTARVRPAPLPSRLTAEELTAHEAFILQMGDKAIWNAYAVKSSSNSN
eukprot:gene2388-2423_t